MPGLLSLDRFRCPRDASPRRRSQRVAVALEHLEERQLLTASAAGVDYALTGFSWSDPAHITYSIAPDGVFWDHGVNNLNAVLDNKVGPGVWERAIATALANWEAVANINIGLVSDSNHDLNTLGQAQGDPRFGDIRFGGYAFPNNTTTLAQTFYPPPNGSTESGDVEVNTAMNFNAGSTYDFYSVMQHETGHSLGLDHATNPADVMYYQYQGVRTGLVSGDIAGIQALYGPRTVDTYTSQGLGSNFGTAIDATPNLDQQGQATLTGTSLATVGATEYFRVVAPSQASGTFQVIAQAGGVSMLSPKVTLYDGSGNLIQTQANPSAWSDNVSVATPSVVPGQVYYVAVTGATSDNFAIGAYHLQFHFSGIPLPSPPSPAPDPSPSPNPGSGIFGPGSSDTPTPSPVATIPPDRFESNNSIATATALGNVSRTTLNNLTLDTGSDVDVFSFRGVKGGVYSISAFGTTIQVVDATGRILASGNDSVSLRVGRPRSTVYVEISATNQVAVSDYTLSIAQSRAGSSSRAPRGPRLFMNRPLAAPALFATNTEALTLELRLATAFPAWFAAHRRRP